MFYLILNGLARYGPTSTNHPKALANGIHCSGRIHGSPVSAFISLCFTRQQFKRHFTSHGSSQPELNAISFYWPHFDWHPGANKAKRKTPAVCRRILFARMLAFFDQHLVARMA